jgi:hypothetical protein
MTTVGPIADPPVDSGSAPDGASENLTSEAPPDAPNPPHRRRVRALLLPGLVLLGLALVLALAPVAHLAARRLPLPPNDPTPIVAGVTRPGTTAMRNLPIGLPPGVTIATTQDLQPYAVAALGSPGAEALMAALSSSDYLWPDGHFPWPYPYRFAALEPILDAAPPADLRIGATQLAAALIMLAGQPGSGNESAASKAAQLAYAVLDRTRAAGGCDGQLDLLLLVAGDPLTTTEILAEEQRRTLAACPDEPTPGWIVGQAQMRNLGIPLSPRPTYSNEELGDTLTTVITTFRDLTRRFPRDPAAVTGLGDAYLRVGLRLLYTQPFTARHDLRLAVAQYNRARFGQPRRVATGRADRNRNRCGFAAPRRGAGGLAGRRGGRP